MFKYYFYLWDLWKEKKISGINNEKTFYFQKPYSNESQILREGLHNFYLTISLMVNVQLNKKFMTLGLEE